MSLLDASPPVEAYRARPYDVSQLDTHPDAARLWATVVALREECSSEGSLSLDSQLKDAETTGYDDGVNNTIATLSRARLSVGAVLDGHIDITHNLDGDIGEALTEPLFQLSMSLEEQLGDVAGDLANLADARTNAKKALTDLREMIAATEGLASIDWRTKHDLQNGRVRANTLAKALKKDELANITMIALHAIYRLSLV